MSLYGVVADYSWNGYIKKTPRPLIKLMGADGLHKHHTGRIFKMNS